MLHFTGKTIIFIQCLMPYLPFAVLKPPDCGENEHAQCISVLAMQKLVEDAVMHILTLTLLFKIPPPPHFPSKNNLSFSSLYKYPSDCVQNEITTAEQRAPEQWNEK